MPYSDMGNNMNKARVGEPVRGSFHFFEVSTVVEVWNSDFNYKVLIEHLKDRFAQ